MNPSNIKWIRLTLGVLIAVMALSSMTNAQPVKAASPATGIACTSGSSPNPTFSLTAQEGYIQMPDMNTMYMWSYGSAAFQHPGPVLCVNQGDTVTITLNNSLPYGLRTSLVFPGQENVLANAAPAQPDFANNSLTTSAANGGSVTYSFVANKPGTFIYESGTDPKTQVTMGLFGALIVRPTMGANYVYNRADSRFTPSEEFIALLSEVDPYQHQAWSLGLSSGDNFDMSKYRARYWLINGRGFPDSIADNNATWLPTQPYGALARIYPYSAATHPYPGVERFINVGTEEYPFHPHGQNGLVIGRDGNPLAGSGGQDLSMEKFAVNIGPGQTWDVTFKWYDAENYSPSNPVPVAAPDLVNLRLGMFFGGSPYLGVKETLPPGVSTLNQCGEYYIISHNHALFQLDAFGQTMSGPITYLRVDPPTPNNCP
ncbi:MAG: multicopper oxidase domain-containing protein [Roseiflexaceae bacterium]|nr:multicopper oxidase domain-containing protein [Roseiflexaceae bacterium]